jgi:hypothetical protein
MNELESVLRAKYRQPRDLVRALGLDESVLREPKKPASAVALDEAMRAGMQKIVSMGQDATLQDFVEFIDMLKEGNSKGAAHEAAELAEEVGAEENEEREELDEDDEDGEAGEKEDNDMEDNSGLPAFAEEREEKAKDEGGNVNAEVAKLLMMAAKKLLGEGGEEHAVDEEIDATDCAAKDENSEERKEAKDEEPKELKEEKKEFPKPAMDEDTIRKIVSASVSAAVDAERKRADRVQVALDEALPYTGRINGKFNTDAEVYHMALDMLGIADAKEIRDATALKIILKSQPLPGSNAAPRPERRLAQDAAAAKDTLVRFPHADRMKRA